MNPSAKFCFSAALILFGAISAGTSVAKESNVTNPDPTSTYQEVQAKSSPTALIQLFSGVALVGVGIGFAASGVSDLNQDPVEESTELSVQRYEVPPSAVAYQLPSEQRTQIQSSVVEEVSVPVLQPQLTTPSPPVVLQPEVSYIIPEPVVYPNPIAAQDYYQESQEPVDTASYVHQEPADQYEDVRSLVHENAVGVIGYEKGSGKTSKLGYLMGEHVKLKHLVWDVNPFAPGWHYKGIKVWGRGHDYQDAAKGIREFTRIAKKRIVDRGDERKRYDPHSDIHIHIALDELSGYSSAIDEVDESVMPDFWMVVVQFIRQTNMSVSFASHGDTQSLLGGAKALKGKSETIKNGMVWLYAQAKTDLSVKGGKRCAGWANLIRPDGGQRISRRISIAEWMQGPGEEYDYRELVQKHCPQFLYLPTGPGIPDKAPNAQGLTPEEFKKRLAEREKPDDDDVWK